MELSNEEEILETGRVVAKRYTIERLLGSGGMGSVYVATDKILGGQQIALKVLHGELVRDESLVRRFLREVELMHKVNHENVVRTFDVGIDGSIVFFTMEFVVGTPLDSLIDSHPPNHPMDPKLIANIGRLMARGLTAIHAADILHRDLKPQNVLILENGSPKITDFGVARTSDSKLTQHREILGSIHYMAPEIWLGQPLTASVDLYALGVILFEMTTGQLPFDGEEPARLMWMHAKQPPKQPRAIRPDTPNWLNQVIVSLLQKSPEGRPKSAHELASFLDANCDNTSHFIRAPEMASGSAAFKPSTMNITSNTNRSVDQPTVVYRASEASEAKEPKSKGWMIIVLLLAFGAIFIPTKEICACLTMREHLIESLGTSGDVEIIARILGPHIEHYVPPGLPRLVAEKKLNILAGSEPGRCSAKEGVDFHCRFVIRKGIVRAFIFEVSLKYTSDLDSRVEEIKVKDYVEYFGIPADF